MPRGRKKTEPASEKIVTEAAESAKIEETAADAIKEDAAAPEVKKRGRKSVAKKEETAAPAEKAETAETPKKRGRKTKTEADAETLKPASTRGRRSASKPAAETAEKLSYDKIVDAVRTKAGSSKSAVDFAAQIALYGDFEGVNPNGGKEFFIKCSEGNIDVQPYNYGGADIEASVDADALLKMISGKLTLSDAVEQGKAEMNKLTAVTIALKNIIS